MNFRRFIVLNIKKKTLKCRGFSNFYLNFFHLKCWNEILSLASFLRSLWECCGSAWKKKSQEDGSHNIVSVLPLVLARSYQEPQPCREQQQRKKAHFQHFKTREDIQLYTGKEHTIFLFIHFKPIRSSLCAYFYSEVKKPRRYNLPLKLRALAKLKKKWCKYLLQDTLQIHFTTSAFVKLDEWIFFAEVLYLKLKEW